MDLAAAKTLLPEIRETVGLASEDWTESYDVGAGRTELCTRDRLTGLVEPIAAILPDCGFADQRLVIRARLYIDALDTLLKHAFRRIRDLEPQESKIAREAARKEADKDFARDCAMKCQDRVFLRFLLEKHGVSDQADAERIATAVRNLLSVQSRAELNTDAAARQRWKDLSSDFYAWRQL